MNLIELKYFLKVPKILCNLAEASKAIKVRVQNIV